MKRNVFSVIILLLALVVNSQVAEIYIPPEADEWENPYAGNPKATIEGARIYKKVCWTCHGDGGTGSGPQAAELKTKPADFNDPLVEVRTDGALFYWISTGGPDMQGFKDSLTEDEIWQVITYVRKLQN